MAFGILFHGRVLAAKTIFVVSTRLHIAALTTRFRELDGEAKSVVKSLLPIMVEIACVSTGMADNVGPFATNLICPVAVYALWQSYHQILNSVLVFPVLTVPVRGLIKYHTASTLPSSLRKIIAYGMESEKYFTWNILIRLGNARKDKLWRADSARKGRFGVGTCAVWACEGAGAGGQVR